jgi:hypothetical protein
MIDLSGKNISEVFEKKGYKFFVSPFSINIFGIRMMTSTNKFDDIICVAYFDDKNKFHVDKFDATTDPGVHWLENPMNRKGCAIMVPGQYRGAYALGRHGRSNKGKGYTAGRQQKPIPVYRDNDKDSVHDIIEETIQVGMYYTNIHHGWSAKYVSKNSAGCQVIKSKTRFEKEFIPLVKKSCSIYGETFTYTLLEKKDFE